MFALSTSLTDTAPGQVSNIRFKRLALDQGMEGGSINTIYQDSKGFIWFGGTTGLFRYDGYAFKIYDETPVYAYSSMYEDTHGSLWSNGSGRVCRVDLATDRVTYYRLGSGCGAWRKFVDAYGDLWVGTGRAGIARYVRADDKFRLYSHDPADPGTLCSDTVYAVYVDRKGKLWVGTHLGLDRFVDSNGTFAHAGELGTIAVFAILEDTEEGLWLLTDDYLCRFDESQGLVERLGLETPPNWFRSSLFQDSKRDLWMETSGGISRLNRSSGRLERIQAPSRNTPLYTYEPFFEDRQGRIWAATTAGLAVCDRQRNVFDVLPSKPQDPRALPQSDMVRAIMEDRSGGIWIAMESGGICLLDRNGAPFVHIGQNPYDQIRLSSPFVGAILEDNAGIVWVGLDHGLDRLDLARGTCIHYGEDKEKPGTLGNHRIMAMVEDPPGTLWIVGDAGLYMMNTAAGTFRRFLPHPEIGRPISNAIRSICIDRAGAIWLGGGDGNGHLDLFDRNAFKITRHFYQSYDSRLEGRGVTPITAIHEDRFGVLWFTAAALGALDRTSWQARFYIPNPQVAGSLSGDPWSLWEDAAGTMWVFTGGGFDTLDRASNTFSPVFMNAPRSPGAWRQLEGGILEDSRGSFQGERRSGNLWIQTPLGIWRFSPSTGAVRVFGSLDGAPIEGGDRTHADFKNRHGFFYFGGKNGFVRFHPDSVHDNTFVPPIVLTAFKKFNADARLDSALTAKKVITLSYAENVISFEFAALDYTLPEKNLYGYTLEGFDRDWVQCGTRRTATYTNLDPGSYVFRVKGSNNDGLWNEEGASVILVVTPPFWKTWWAYAVYVLFVIGLFYGLQRFQQSRLVLKHEVELKEVEAKKLKEVDRMKSRFFANISHEFRTPLTLILGPLETVRAKVSDEGALDATRVIKRSAQRLLRLVNQLLDLSKLEAGALKLHASRMNIVPLIRGITFSFESSAALKHVNVAFVSDEAEIEVYADKDVVEKIFTNLLSNALKFTPTGGSVGVMVDLIPLTPPSPVLGEGGRGGEVLQISVSDTGIGIPADHIDKIFDRFYQVDSSQTREHEGTGLGLALVKELIELHHWTIRVRSEIGQGTTFTVQLPLGRTYLNDDEIVEGAVSSGQTGIEPEGEAPSEATRSLSEASGDRKPGPESPIVLVVEDNTDVRGYIGSYLKSLYHVGEAADGEEGVAAAIETIPDLIISDLMMPKKDGLELCRVLKNDERTSHIPIVLLTARADMKDKVEGLETGADDYLVKPFSPEELLARVKNLIESRRKLRERFAASVLLKPGEVAVAPRDVAFMTRMMAAVEQNIGNERFHVDELAAEAGMSRIQLHRKITALTNQSPGEFIRYIRLHRAMQLLQKDAGTVSEIAYMVGFSDPSNFSRCFHKQFGKAPSEISKI